MYHTACIPFGMRTPCTSDDDDEAEELTITYPMKKRSKSLLTNIKETSKSRNQLMMPLDQAAEKKDFEQMFISNKKFSPINSDYKINYSSQKDNLPEYIPLEQHIHLLMDNDSVSTYCI